MSTETMKSLFAYKAWANQELFTLLGTLLLAPTRF